MHPFHSPGRCNFRIRGNYPNIRSINHSFELRKDQTISQAPMPGYSPPQVQYQNSDHFSVRELDKPTKGN